MFSWLTRRKPPVSAPEGQAPSSDPEVRGGGSESQVRAHSGAPAGAVTRDISHNDWHVRLDLTPQVLSLQIPATERLVVWDLDTTGAEALAPTCRSLPSFRCAWPPRFVSASMLAIKAKLFDDGLYAAVELASQGAKAKLLASLVNLSPLVAAAARLGGLEAPASIEAQEITNTFLGDELQSKPLGFYTWNDALGRIFQQDRLLQQKLAPADAAALAAALSADSPARKLYGDCLELAAKLTNPFPEDMRDLRQPGGDRFFPPSRSHEVDLVKALYGNRQVPDDFLLASEMIKRIRDRSLSLAPTARSGWYDWQAWALEPLAVPERMPEAPRLQMNAQYREQLEELFNAILALARETHVKQLEHPICGAAMGRQPRVVIVHVEPELTVEPLPTCYERRAKSYEFVRCVLEGAGLLHGTKRQAPDGPFALPLDEELDEMIAIFKGAAAMSREELGIEAATGPEAARFRGWAEAPDMKDDIRMMVPVFYDIERGQTKVWAVLGWSTRELRVEFARNPAVHIIEGNVKIKFEPVYKKIAYPVFAEAYVKRLLDRDEFRAHCDRYKTREQILANL